MKQLRNYLKKKFVREMIHRLLERDLDSILEVINDAAQAYKGVIPDDGWKEPYMSAKN